MRRLSIALCVASIFKGRRKRTGRLKVRGALPAVQPRLRPTRFRGRPKAPHDAFRLCDGRQKEKRTLPGAFADVSRLVCVATCPTSCEVVVVSSSWSRNFDLVPFRSGEILDNAAKHCLDSHRLEEQKLPHVSGPTDPCPNAVHMEPFSTSVFKDLI